MTLGARIRELRKAKGISTQELSNRIGVSMGYIAQMERDRLISLPSEARITQLAEVLDADKLELMLLADKLPKEYEAMIKKELKQEPKSLDQLSAMFRRR